MDLLRGGGGGGIGWVGGGERMNSWGVLLEYTLIWGEMMGDGWGGGGGDSVFWRGFTSWHSGLRERRPPPPPASADATGRWGGGGWPACRTSVWARPPRTCFPPRSSRWRRFCRSCRNPELWSQRGFSEGNQTVTRWIQLDLQPPDATLDLH